MAGLLLLLGLLSIFPLSVAAEDDLSREEAQKKLDETSQKLQSSRAQEQGLAQDIAALAEARAKLNTDLIEAGKQVQASEAKLSETEAKLAELTEEKLTEVRDWIEAAGLAMRDGVLAHDAEVLEGALG